MNKNHRSAFTIIDTIFGVACISTLFLFVAAFSRQAEESATRRAVVFAKVKSMVEERALASAPAVAGAAREMLTEDELSDFVKCSPGYIPKSETKGPTLVRLPRGSTSGAIVPIVVPMVR